MSFPDQSGKGNNKKRDKGKRNPQPPSGVEEELSPVPAQTSEPEKVPKNRKNKSQVCHLLLQLLFLFRLRPINLNLLTISIPIPTPMRKRLRKTKKKELRDAPTKWKSCLNSASSISVFVLLMPNSLNFSKLNSETNSSEDVDEDEAELIKTPLFSSD